MSTVVRLTRRELLLLGVGGASGLALGIRQEAEGQPGARTSALRVDGWLHVAPSGEVTIACPPVEMGQGVMTSLAMLVAEELEADWARVRVVPAPFDPRRPAATGGSMSVRGYWEPMRRTGAAARQMLVAAAAKRWGVPAGECQARAGSVIHAATRRKATYGELAAHAARLPVPRRPALKPPAGFRLIGRRIRRVDTPSKTDGSVAYSMDVRLPGMLYAVLARSPVFGGRPAAVNGAGARRIKGVREVVRVRDAVAVVADNTWTAIQARDNGLKVEWAEPEGSRESSEALRTRLREAASKPGTVVRESGAPPASPEGRRVEGSYDVGFQPHAAMEPLNCTAHARRDACDIWAAAQVPGWARGEAARALGLPPDSVRIHPTLVGGSFGRCLNPDFVVEAALVSRAVGAPVKLVFYREDDIQHDFYRPASLHRLMADLDSDGWPVTWTHRIASTSLAAWLDPKTPRPQESEVGGAVDLPYGIPFVRIEYAHVDSPVPRGWWRSVEHTPNAFAIECFLDELAAAGGKDPLALRLRLLDSPPEPPRSAGSRERLQGVLRLAAEKAGWGLPLPARSGRGIACHYSFGTYVAQVAEAAVDKDGNVTVKRVVCAVDCGQAVNPDGIAAQLEGSVAFGLTAALKAGVVVENGRVSQSNFHNYEPLHMGEMPQVEVHLVRSSEPPGGMGEPGVPPVAPALCNALYAATGVRIRQLPVRTRLLRQRG